MKSHAHCGDCRFAVCQDGAKRGRRGYDAGKKIKGRKRHIAVDTRILQQIADDLEIPKLNFQILRRTIATRAQKLGSVKDIRSHLRHSRADTTANEYMQELPESVQQMVGTVYELLTTATPSQQIM